MPDAQHLFLFVLAGLLLNLTPGPDVLYIVGQALRSGGLLYASFKTGGTEGVDRFGRYYNHPDAAFLREALGAGWSSIAMVQRAGSGYCNLPAEWLQLSAVKA